MSNIIINYYELYAQLKSSGFFDVLLPWALAFVVTYMFLEQIDWIKEEKIKVLLAFAVGLIFSANYRLVQAILVAIPQVAYFLLALTMYYIAITVVKTPKLEDNQKHWKQYIAAISAIVIFLIFLNAAGLFNIGASGTSTYSLQRTIQDLIPIIGVLSPFIIMLLIVWFVMKGSSSQSRDNS